jgi:hypothetical protein
MYSFGWCSGIEEAERFRKLGFDYIECALASLNLEDDAAFAEKLPQYTESPIPVRAFNIFSGRTEGSRAGRKLGLYEAGVSWFLILEFYIVLFNNLIYRYFRIAEFP